VVAWALLVGGAAAAIRTFAPVQQRHGVLTFRLTGVEPDQIRAGRLAVRGRRYGVGLRHLRSGAGRGLLHVRLPRDARKRLRGRRGRVRLILTTRGPGSSTSFPIRAAFYYPWFPQTWKVGGVHTHFHPSLGYYSTDTPAVQRAHIRALDYAGMDAAISEWKPPPHYLNRRLEALLARTAAARSHLKWAIYYSPEGSSDPAPSKIAADLTYVRNSLATDPGYLRVNGKFVVFVWSSGPTDQSCSLADRWKAANAQIGSAAYVVLKVFPGYRTCASQPDSWHQYGPAAAASQVPGYSYSISPGFWKANETSPRLGRDLARFQQTVRDMVASHAPWQLVTTFNEWGEGTAVESASEWRARSGEGAFLDALHAVPRPAR
jgi:hypothetical protein